MKASEFLTVDILKQGSQFFTVFEWDIFGIHRCVIN